MLIVYWGLLGLLTHIPTVGDLGPLFQADKLLHFVAYAGLSFLLALAVSLRRPLTLRGYLPLLTVVAIYGAIDELTQQFVPGRVCDFQDWLADMAGAIVGLLTFYILWRYASRKLLPQAPCGN